MATAFNLAATPSSCLQLAASSSVINKFTLNGTNNVRPGVHLTSLALLRCQTRRKVFITAMASSSDIATAADWGEPVSLGTVKLPPDVNLQKLEGFLFQWGNSLTQNANLPLPVPLKVDKIDGGVRLGYIRLVDGAIEDLAHIDCVVSPGTGSSSAMFRALRCGRYKNEVPPAEPAIMQSLLQALKKSIELARV